MRVILAYAQFLHTTLLSRLNLSFPSPPLPLHKESVSLGFEVNERFLLAARVHEWGYDIVSFIMKRVITLFHKGACCAKSPSFPAKSLHIHKQVPYQQKTS